MPPSCSLHEHFFFAASLCILFICIPHTHALSPLVSLSVFRCLLFCYWLHAAPHRTCTRLSTRSPLIRVFLCTAAISHHPSPLLALLPARSRNQTLCMHLSRMSHTAYRYLYFLSFLPLAMHHLLLSVCRRTYGIAVLTYSLTLYVPFLANLPLSFGFQ
jgi:hypothetical protein